MTPSATGPAVRFEDVSLTYAGAASPTLSRVDLEIESGELVLVVGRTGSGKSTLLGMVNGLVPHLTGGRLEGRVLVHGQDTRTHRPRDLAELVGVVGQDPLAGFVTDTVEEELAYGMEQLGLPPATMRTRVEETLDLLGLAQLRSAPLRFLSGGEQQRVAIGSVLTAHPRVLVLDEPTSALDPTGAEEVLAALTRLVHDLAMTVVVAEHRLERVLQYADRVVSVEGGRVGVGDPAVQMATSPVAPPVVELGRWFGWSPLPRSVREGVRASSDVRHRLDKLVPESPGRERPAPDAAALTTRGLVVRYSETVAVAGVDAALSAGRVTSLMGRNGCGKSSLLWAIQGSGPRTSGSVSVNGQDPADLSPVRRRGLVGLVPQSPGDLLYLPTVRTELDQSDTESDRETGTTRGLLADLLPGSVPGMADHPADLSEGQRLALVLAIALAADPAVLLLDEPTRGLDYAAKSALAATLRDLSRRGRAVLLSTHDVEFVAEVADEVWVMAAGELVAQGPAAEVVTASPAYAPQVAKVLGHGLLTVAGAREVLA